MVRKVLEILYIILGIIILFVPGFLLSFLLFPGPEDLDVWERIATSVGVSALVDMVIITILAQPALSALKLVPVVGSIFAFCGVCAVVLFLRKKSLRTFRNFWSRSNSGD